MYALRNERIRGDNARNRGVEGGLASNEQSPLKQFTLRSRDITIPWMGDVDILFTVVTEENGNAECLQCHHVCESASPENSVLSLARWHIDHGMVHDE